jgi:DNA-binding response OmpR family regulator
MISIFLVDDDDNYRELVEVSLQEDCGVDRVQGFARGGLLLQHFAQHPLDVPALLLLDLHMPGTSGLELLQQVRRVHARLPVAFLSGAVVPQEREACLAAGAVDFLLKPLAYADLTALLQELLRTAGAEAHG